MAEKVNPKEYSVITCKNCKKTLKRYNHGKFSNSKDTRWLDEDGKLFNGKTCPQCHSDACARRKRNNKRVVE